MNIFFRAVVLLWLGFKCASAQTTDPTDPQTHLSVRQSGYFFTSPLLDCQAELSYIPPFKQELQDYIQQSISDKKASRISVYFRQLNNGYSFGINENVSFQPASLMKVANMMFILKLSETDANILNDKVAFVLDNSEELGETKLVEGNSYTVWELIKHMVVYSDNQAMMMLHGKFNNKVMWESVYTDLGFTIQNHAGNLKTMTPKMYSVIFQVLYNGSYLDKEHSEMALSLLARTSFTNGIVKGINDSSVVVANKFGLKSWSDRYQLHEAAIVYLRGLPYLLTIMTESEKAKGLTDVISGISKIVYNKCKRSVINYANSPAGMRIYENALVNPLIDCYTSPIVLKNFKSKVDSLVELQHAQGLVTDVSVYFRQLYNGHTFTINGQERYKPASLMKVPHMMALLKAAEKQPDLLNQKFKFDQTTLPFKQNITDLTIKVGEEYSMLNLIERMTIYSDNNAMELIYQSRLNQSEVWANMLHDLGLGHLWRNEKISMGITCDEFSMFFRVLYNSTYLNRVYSERALQMLSRSTFKVGIRKGIGKDDYAATKFGETTYMENGTQVAELHEAGIVYFEDNPYVICVMTRGKNLEDLSKCIEQISNLTYSEMGK